MKEKTTRERGGRNAEKKVRGRRKRQKKKESKIMKERIRERRKAE